MDKPWADQPFELIPSPTDPKYSQTVRGIATHMAFAHNMMIRNLNAIYLQCCGLSPASSPAKDITDFFFFIDNWCHEITLHHGAEEEWLFPWIEEYTGVKGIMEANVSQHHEFHPGLEKLEAYSKNTAVDAYNGEEVKAIIDGFGSILTEHLAAEIVTLCELDQYGPEKLAKCWKDLEGKLLPALDPYIAIPGGLGAIDASYDKNQKAPFPFFVPYLCSFWFIRRHRGAWRFSPCTVHGKKRPLKFLPQSEK